MNEPTINVAALRSAVERDRRNQARRAARCRACRSESAAYDVPHRCMATAAEMGRERVLYTLEHP